MSIQKPQLRGLLHSSTKKHFVGMLVVLGIAGAGYQLTIINPRKKAYADFYKTYDPEAALKIMNDAGLMQSCPK